MVGKEPQQADREQKKNYRRRNVMKSGVAIGGAVTMPGMVSADNSDDVASSSTPDSNGVETELITEGDNYKLFKTISEDREALGKFYTDGPKEGKLEHLTLKDGEKTKTSQSSSGSAGSLDQTTALSTVETSGVEIVKRSTNVNRALDSCTQDYCDGFTYTHVQTGFSVEFTDVADAFGKSVIAEAVSVLAEMYMKAKWARWVGGLASIVAGTILSVATGAEYTVSPWDQDKGWVFTNPVVELGVSGGWDTHAHNLTNVQDNERAHIGSLDGRCG